MWRLLVALIVIFVVISILGAILDALRWLLGVAVVVAIGALIVGALGRSQSH